MSNAATSAFLAAWRSASRRPVGLCQIDLVTPSAVTLYVATTGVITPDGTTWEPGFACEPIRDEIGFLEPGPGPVTVQFTLGERAYTPLDPTTVLESLRSYQWKNATVTMYLWEQSLASFSDALQVFKGRIDSVEAAPGTLTLTAMQDRAWNRVIPSVSVDKATYPNASDSASGQPVPIVYGEHTSPTLRGPLASTGFESDFENAGGARGVVPLIVADTGAGSDKVRLLAASHALADLYGAADSTRLYMAGAGGYLCPLDTSAGYTETLSTTSYADVDDDTMVAWYPIVPVDVRVGGGNNSAVNPRRAMDIGDETNYATLNQSSSYNKLDLFIGSPARFGTISSVKIVACVSGDAANTHNFRLYGRGTAHSSTTVTASSTSASPSIISGTYDTNWWSQNWAFGVQDGSLAYGGANGDQISLCVDFAGGTTNKGRVYWVALYVICKPERNLILAGTGAKTMAQLAVESGNAGASRYWSKHNIEFANQFVTKNQWPIFSVDGAFFANLNGYADDGSGTYTGSAGSIIKCPPDVLRHFLVTHGQISDSDILSTSSTHGSFADARSALRNAQPNDYALACHMGQKSSVQEMAQKMCAQSLTTFWLDRFDNKWRFGVWKKGAPIDYDLPLSWYQVASYFRAEEGSLVDLRNEVRIGWLYDHFKGKALAEAFVGPNGSSQGWSQPTTRDQLLTVTAGVNDDMDWKTGAWGGGPFTYADTLAAGTYTPLALAAEIQSKMRARVGAYYSYVGHGFTVESGYNDVIEFGYGASSYAGVVTPGRYSAEDLALAVAKEMNEQAGLEGVITCTYSQSTNKFTIASSGSNVSIIGPTTAVDPGLLLWPVMGWVAGTISAASLTAPRETYYDRFWVRCEPTFTFQFLFGSGASASTSIAKLIGYEASDTSVAAYQSATYSRGDRETLSTARQSAYGVTDVHTVLADWVRDENSAVSLRDRTWDLTSTPPMRVVFDTYTMPDLRRFQSFGVSDDMDARVPFSRYGSDGTWSYKSLRCLGTIQHMGPTFQTEVIAVEA